ncbi:hypothetical protein BJ944DRAFT_99921 [Cunninghamella echinulata]|nr:hypothetical protein BJ944DRAFT_99921 [Cunninghamella echinulata]
MFLTVTVDQVSTPRSENSSPAHPSLKSNNSYNKGQSILKSNILQHEDTNKKKSNKNLSSPKRTPLQDKNTSTIVLPSTKKTLSNYQETSLDSSILSKENHFNTAPPKIQNTTSPRRHHHHHHHQSPLSPSQQQNQSKKNVQLLLSPSNNNKTKDIHLIYPDHSSFSSLLKHNDDSTTTPPSTANKENKNKIVPSSSSSSSHTYNLTHRLYKEQQKELEIKLKKANQEKEKLVIALKQEKEKTLVLKTWFEKATLLIQQIKTIDEDIDDSIDIVKEYESIMEELEVEMQQDKLKQDEIDHLMNLIPEKMMEVEELKSSLGKQ